jgi:hypothetical protein
MEKCFIQYVNRDRLNGKAYIDGVPRVSPI